VVLNPSPATTIGEARDQASGALGDAVDLKDAMDRRLHNNGATFEQYRAQLPIEGSEARGLRGGMPPEKGAFPLYCALATSCSSVLLFLLCSGSFCYCVSAACLSLAEYISTQKSQLSAGMTADTIGVKALGNGELPPDVERRRQQQARRDRLRVVKEQKRQGVFGSPKDLVRVGLQRVSFFNKPVFVVDTVEHHHEVVERTQQLALKLAQREAKSNTALEVNDEEAEERVAVALTNRIHQRKRAAAEETTAKKRKGDRRARGEANPFNQNSPPPQPTTAHHIPSPHPSPPPAHPQPTTSHHSPSQCCFPFCCR
jgi:hypothetical protein